MFRRPPVPVRGVFPTAPKFLIAVDGSGAGTNVNVFPVNATTGVLGAAVSGSPFDLGLTAGMTLAVHPNGHFVYAADPNNGSIHMWNVNETTGNPVQTAAPVINESGIFYQPCCGPGDAATHVITITPKGASSTAPAMTYCRSLQDQRRWLTCAHRRPQPRGLCHRSHHRQ